MFIHFEFVLNITYSKNNFEKYFMFKKMYLKKGYNWILYYLNIIGTKYDTT